MSKASKKRKITYTFHNPNTEEATVRYISDILAEVMVAKVRKRVEESFKEQCVGEGETAI